MVEEGESACVCRSLLQKGTERYAKRRRHGGRSVLEYARAKVLKEERRRRSSLSKGPEKHISQVPEDHLRFNLSWGAPTAKP